MTVVGYGINGTNRGTWHFINWKDGYDKIEISTITEAAFSPAQAVLADPETSRIFRIYYGRRYSTVSRTLRVDTLETTRNTTTNEAMFKSAAKSQPWEIVWPATQEEDYLKWNLVDVNGDGVKDLVAYTADGDNINVNVIVFPGLISGGFRDPVVSAITLPEKIALRVTADFMRPWSTSHSSYTYPNGERTNAAFMAFFDNFGLVGARIVAPVNAKGTFQYEIKGQTGSIAGQRSNFLGTRPREWMGRRQRSSAVGLVALTETIDNIQTAEASGI